jgi:glycosyltransferase involved in cell wall biosynthesis
MNLARSLRLARWADVTILQKPMQPVGAIRLVAAAARTLLVDLDDALWAPIADVPDAERHARIRLRRLTVAVRLAAATLTGSAYLAEWIGVHLDARPAYVVPSAVALSTSEPSRTRSTRSPLVVGWIGSPSNLRDLEVARPALARLADDHQIVVRVVSSQRPELDGVPIDFRPWSPEGEAAELEGFDLGIMPLHDDEAGRGRCGYKAIQYMAAGLPVVASPVGGGAEVLDDGSTGFYARDPDAWCDAITKLRDPDLRVQLGRAGIERVRRLYSREQVSRRLAAIATEEIADA